MDNPATPPLRTFIVEHVVLGAGKLGKQKFLDMSRTSCHTLSSMGPRIQWVQTYVTGDKLFCVFMAESEADIREHAAVVGLPADHISELVTVLSPALVGADCPAAPPLLEIENAAAEPS